MDIMMQEYQLAKNVVGIVMDVKNLQKIVLIVLNHHSELEITVEPVLMDTMIMELTYNAKNVQDFATLAKLILIYAQVVLIQNIEQEAIALVLTAGIVMVFQIIVYHATVIVKLVQDQKNAIVVHHIPIEN